MEENKILKLVKEKNSSFPIIEKLKNNSLYVRITFIYLGNERTKNILVVSPIGRDKLKENLMVNIENTNIWYKSYVCRADIKFRYYLSINDSLVERDTKRLANSQYDKLNELKLKFNDGFIISYIQLPKCRRNKYYIKVKEEGTLVEYKIYSEILKEERKFSVYIPKQIGKKDYGMAVFTDREENISILKTHQILDRLIEKKEIEPIIAVFIENNYNRGRDLKFNREFEKFLIQELVVFIKKSYSISEKPCKNIICGFSLGGLFATYVGIRNSNIFQNILTQSAAYFIDERRMRKEIKSLNKKMKVYISTGILENKDIMINPNRRIYGVLRKNKFKVKYEEFKSGHDYLEWGEFFGRGISYLLRKED